MKKKIQQVEIKKEYLEQEDYYDNEYIEKVSEKYAGLIGSFIIKFSELEYEIDQAIAKSFIDDCDSEGYRIIKFLNINNKIELFYEIYLERANFINKKNIPLLKKIKKDLDSLRIFRNQLAHANWTTLTKEGYVRTKIESDKHDGMINLVKVRILPRIIRDYTNRLDSTLLKIGDYLENGN